MIPANIIEEIRNKADIVTVISDYLKLRKRGKNYLGLCPFHPEKDPSFTVSPDKQMFHCFGCNKGGNVFAFLMEIENINFVEAVQELGQKLNIAVPKGSGSQVSRGEKEKLQQVIDLALKYFQDSVDQELFLKRGLTEKTIAQFRLGFAPAGWDNLFKYLISRGAAPDQIEKSGLILARENNSGYYDRFRHRLIFPIFDARGRAVAFGGRALGDEEPKYLNSPDTAIYHKGETLYGLDLSKDQIKKQKTAILVEGYFDLITPFQHGFTNIVASCGTALTAAQAKLLGRYAETVIIAYDADAAGSIAAERSIELFRNQGLKVKIARLSCGKDPDEIIKNKGAEFFGELISQALPFLEFKIRTIAGRHNLKEIEGRGKALGEIAALLSREQDQYLQKEYAKMAAELIKTDTDSIISEISRASHTRGLIKNSLSRTVEKPTSRLAEAEKNLVLLAVQNQEALTRIRSELKPDDFTLPPARESMELIFASDLSGQALAHFLLDNLPGEESRAVLSQLLVSDHLANEKESLTILADCLQTIKKEQTKTKLAAIRAEVQAAEHAGDAARAAELLAILKSEIN